MLEFFSAQRPTVIARKVLSRYHTHTWLRNQILTQTSRTLRETISPQSIGTATRHGAHQSPLRKP